MNKFEGIDYFDLSELLTSEEIMMRDTIRQFVDEEVIPIIEKYYTEGTLPIHLVKKWVNWVYSVLIYRKNTDVPN